MNTDQIKEINTRLALIEAEMGRIRVMVRELSQQPESADPNHYIPQPGEVVEVSDDKIVWHTRIYDSYNGGKFYVIGNLAESNYRNGISKNTVERRFCRRLNGEIIEFGCDKAKQEDNGSFITNSAKADETHDKLKYLHLLPEGYEFCTEEMAEKWVKFCLIDGTTPENQHPIGFIWNIEDGNLFHSYKPYYRPIRKIQSEPNPYAIDWTQAPDWADVHAFDENGNGWWYGATQGGSAWWNENASSEFTLPAGLDWKLSKTYRPR